MTSPLQIAFVIDRYFEFGGLQRDCLRLARACSERDAEVTIITGSWSGEKPANLTIREVDTNALTNTGKVEKLEQAMEGIRLAQPFDCVTGFKKMRGLDIYYAGDPCLAATVKAQGFVKQRLPRYRKLLKNEAAVFGKESATLILLIAHQEQEKFMHHYGTAENRFVLLPPGIDRDRFTAGNRNQDARNQIRKQYGLTENDFLVLQVGSAFRTKGVDRSISAVAALSQELAEKVKLVVIGAGDTAPYQAMATQLGLADRVIFPGPQKNVADYYYAADLLVHPAKTENTGTALLEAMVCGLPVLTTGNCGYASHVLKAQAGAVSPEPFNRTAFNILFETMLDKSKLTRWQVNGLRYSQTEDLYSMIVQAADTIINVAKNNRQQS